MKNRRLSRNVSQPDPVSLWHVPNGLFASLVFFLARFLISTCQQFFSPHEFLRTALRRVLLQSKVWEMSLLYAFSAVCFHASRLCSCIEVKKLTDRCSSCVSTRSVYETTELFSKKFGIRVTEFVFLWIAD